MKNPTTRHVALSDSSAEPWYPERARSSQLGDLLWSAAAAGLAWWWTKSSSWSWLVASAAAIGVSRLLRALPPLSYDELLKSEAHLLSTVGGDVRHHWTSFTTRRATWRIHALWLRSPAAAAAEDAAIPGAFPGEAAGAAHRLPLVLLHGHSTSSAHWECILDRLGQYADVILVDLPGWGRSPAPPALAEAVDPTTTGDLHVELLEGWLRANRLERVVLIGHSLGSFYATLFASCHPERVSHLVLVSPAGLTPTMPSFSVVWGIYFKYIPPQLIARVFGRLGGVVFRSLYLLNTTEDPRFAAQYYLLAAATAYTGLADRCAARFLRFSLLGGGVYWRRPCLSLLLSTPVPVSVIVGNRDVVISPLFGPLIHRLRPLTDLYVIKNAEHNPAHSNADLFCAAMIDCIQKQRGQSRTLRPHALSAEMCEFGTADVILSDDPVPPAAAVASTAPAPAAAEPEAAPQASPAAADWQMRHSHDGIDAERQAGRGHCLSCLEPVVLSKAYWRCACAAWSFNADVWSLRTTRARFGAMLDFLTELYVQGTFNAQTSACLHQSVPVRVDKTGAATTPRAASVVRREPSRQQHAPPLSFTPARAPFVRGDVFVLEAT
jgi:pimeloyl-ACP methyl ester carboxylesterase